MAYDGASLKLVGKTAAADLSAEQFHFVKLDGSGNVAAATAQGAISIGVLQNTPANIGDPCEIIYLGETKLKGDGTAHAEGSVLCTAADGEADAAEAADFVLGVALTTPDATAGAVFTALINCANPTVV